MAAILLDSVVVVVVRTSNTASHDKHEKIHRWVSLDFHIRDAYGAPLGGPSGRRSSAINSIRGRTKPLFYRASVLKYKFDSHGERTDTPVLLKQRNRPAYDN